MLQLRQSKSQNLGHDPLIKIEQAQEIIENSSRPDGFESPNFF